MGTAHRKRSLFDTGFKIRELAAFPVFNFFKSCLNSARPEWGSPIVNFKMPGPLRRTAKAASRANKFFARKG